MDTGGTRARGAVLAIASAVALVALILGLAACGDDTVGGGSSEEVTTAKAGPVSGELTISNWPGYVDPGPEGKRGQMFRWHNNGAMPMRVLADSFAEWLDRLATELEHYRFTFTDYGSLQLTDDSLG